MSFSQWKRQMSTDGIPGRKTTRSVSSGWVTNSSLLVGQSLRTGCSNVRWGIHTNGAQRNVIAVSAFKERAEGFHVEHLQSFFDTTNWRQLSVAAELVQFHVEGEKCDAKDLLVFSFRNRRRQNTLPHFSSLHITDSVEVFVCKRTPFGATHVHPCPQLVTSMISSGISSTRRRRISCSLSLAYCIPFINWNRMTVRYLMTLSLFHLRFLPLWCEIVRSFVRWVFSL